MPVSRRSAVSVKRSRTEEDHNEYGQLLHGSFEQLYGWGRKLSKSQQFVKEADPILRPTAIANNADRLRVPLDNGQRSVDTDSSDPFHDLHHPWPTTLRRTTLRSLTEVVTYLTMTSYRCSGPSFLLRRT